MIPTPALARPARATAAAASVVGAVLLTGCAAESAPAAETTETATATATAEPTETAAAVAEPDSTYVDGTYSAEGSYATPETVETITVTVTLEDDVVTAVSVTGNPSKRESVQFQGEFIGGIAEVVVGKPIDELAVSRVAGSSLTSGGFNQALEIIKAEAKA
ncbi:hypothetical protein [Microbacterium sp.]|uniref:hypothetical protein n=1 Tax=Microbacterium sp. TaxID=51671 RepID=UPI0039E37E47